MSGSPCMTEDPLADSHRRYQVSSKLKRPSSRRALPAKSAGGASVFAWLSWSLSLSSWSSRFVLASSFGDLFPLADVLLHHRCSRTRTRSRLSRSSSLSRYTHSSLSPTLLSHTPLVSRTLCSSTYNHEALGSPRSSHFCNSRKAIPYLSCCSPSAVTR